MLPPQGCIVTRHLSFISNGTVQTTSAVSHQVHSNMDNWATTDAVLAKGEDVYCRAALVTSLKMSGYNRHKRQEFEERCMPVWSLGELRKVYTGVYTSSGSGSGSGLAWESCGEGYLGRHCNSPVMTPGRGPYMQHS